jgi:hypothetical protein
MTILLSRDSACMADDMESHDQTLELPDDSSLHDIISAIVSTHYLPTVAHETVTWSVSAKQPLAVISQNRRSPILLTLNPDFALRQNLNGSSLALHCSYIGHVDAEIVSNVLRRFSWPQPKCA